MPTAIIRRSRGWSASSIVRFGVIGVGGMGRGHCQGLARVARAKLTAVCDVDPHAAENAGKEFGVPYFSDHRQLIQSGGCDVVIIATPHPWHAAVAIDGINAGLHVISEKPLAERISKAEQMVKTAKKKGVALAVVFQRRFEPVFAQAMEMVKRGRLGRIYRTVMISPEYRSQTYYDSGAWRATWKGEGGGVTMNQSPHILDLFIQIGGMPSEVLGRTETRLHRIEVEDLAEAMLKYPDGGTGYLYCSTCEPPPGQMIEVFGDKGKLIIRDNEFRFFTFHPEIRQHIRQAKTMWEMPGVREEKVLLPKKETGHFLVAENMVRHLLNGAPLVTSGESGLASLELANAITLSAHEGRWVKLPINRKRYDALLDKFCRESSLVKKPAKTVRMTDPRFRRNS